MLDPRGDQHRSVHLDNGRCYLLTAAPLLIDGAVWLVRSDVRSSFINRISNNHRLKFLIGCPSDSLELTEQLPLTGEIEGAPVFDPADAVWSALQANRPSGRSNSLQERDRFKISTAKCKTDVYFA